LVVLHSPCAPHSWSRTQMAPAVVEGREAQKLFQNSWEKLHMIGTQKWERYRKILNHLQAPVCPDT
jgi:hypothetical protein